MTPESLFQIANGAAMLCWIVLLVLHRQPVVTRVILPVGAVGLLSLLYGYLIVSGLDGWEGGFDSLSNVSLLFQNQTLLLAGWVHYLAFDLFVGCWEVRDARRQDISIILILPALVLTFMFGPIGLIAYFLIRFVRTGNAILDDHLFSE
ncbi:TPA: DUF4281 domain-containing protein [Candidatus Latescibacteria bacterium]|nr:DUF4281 domain-containing protein [Candidatus Latescibacterota bacterium]